MSEAVGHAEVARMALVKYLFGMAERQSRLPPPLYGLSVLSLHDAIELFLQLASEVHNVKADNFMGYWSSLGQKFGEDLSHAEGMRRLNRARVALKHHGTLPSRMDVDSFFTTSRTFFDENALRLLSVSFAEVSLVDLIDLRRTREALKRARLAIDAGDLDEAIGQIAIGFDECLDEYRDRRLAALPTDRLRYASRDSEIDTWLREGDLRDLGLGSLYKTIQGFDRALHLLSLGVDYERYRRLKVYWPAVLRFVGRRGPVVERAADITVPMAIVQESFDLVVETALLLQDRLTLAAEGDEG